jgi:hypothetical protein
VRLLDRHAEKQALHHVLDSVRAGMSGALVLRGEPGVGKSALLDYAVERAADLQIVRTVAVESEMALGFAAVHQLLVPFLRGVDRLPGPQRRALGVAFGLESGTPADLFLVGLAVLMLLSDTARVQPVLCVIDDAQWLDDESADVLGFVARRLLADRVGMLLAIRETTEPDPHLQVLPGLRLAGLPKQDAYALLETSISRPIDAGMAERIVVETGGNPLAIVEAAAELTPEQLGGREPLPEPMPVGHQLEDLFVRRVRELPADTQTLLLLAAAEQPGRSDRLCQAAAALGIPESAAVPAEATGMVAFGPEVRFSHPLVRSAVYHGAAPGQRREAHRALAAACDPHLDVVPRAWYLAAAGPDEGVAAQLSAAAARAKSRGGYAATAALLERAALLTPDEERRAGRRLSAADAYVLAEAVDRAEAHLAEAATGLHDPLSAAQATRLEGRIRVHRGQVAGAAASTAVYGLPEVASVGATEEHIQATGIPYAVGRCDLATTPRGAIAGHGGLLKLIFHADYPQAAGRPLLRRHRLRSGRTGPRGPPARRQDRTIPHARAQHPHLHLRLPRRDCRRPDSADQADGHG